MGTKEQRDFKRLAKATAISGSSYRFGKRAGRKTDRHPNFCPKCGAGKGYTTRDLSLPNYFRCHKCNALFSREEIRRARKKGGKP